MTGESASLQVARAGSGVVLGCALNPRQRANVVDGLKRTANCHFVDSYGDLDAMLPTLTRCDAFVLAPQDQRGRDAVDTVRRVAQEWPQSGVVIFCPPRDREAVSVRTLALAGAHQFVFQDMFDAATALARAVASARRDCAAEVVVRQLAPLLPLDVHSILHVVASHPESATTVGAVAKLLGVNRKTLVNRCARSRCLQPTELINWCRVALVSQILVTTGSTVEAIGLTLGFPSHTSLRNLIRRYTGRRATDIRNEGTALVLASLEARLASWRTEASAS